jgi:hypothetical protein
MPKHPASKELQAVIDRAGESAIPDAFSPVAFSALNYPGAREWSAISPPTPAKVNKPRGFVPNIPAAPKLPPRLAKYIKKSDTPYRRLLRADPLPGESKKNAAARVKKVWSFLGEKASHQRTSNLRARQAGRVGKGVEWRIAITGHTESFRNGSEELGGKGTQRSGWRQLAPGKTITDEEIKAAYFDVSREAVQSATSKLYKGTSEGAIFRPHKAVIEYRQPDGAKTKSYLLADFPGNIEAYADFSGEE